MISNIRGHPDYAYEDGWVYNIHSLAIKPLHIDADGRAFVRLGNIEEGAKVVFLHDIITDIVRGVAPKDPHSSSVETQTDVSQLKEDFLPPEVTLYPASRTNACLPTYANTPFTRPNYQNASSYRGGRDIRKYMPYRRNVQ